MNASEKVILLVEDNPDDEELTLLALEENHILNTVVVAHDGAEALDYLFGRGAYVERDPRVLPQLILLDLKLPKVNGMEVLRALRSDERTKFVPVVMLTSSNEERELIQSYALGVNSYIVKPVDFDKFIKAVSELGLYWLLLNQPPM